MINTIYKNSSINNIIYEPYADEMIRWQEAQKTHLGKLLAKPKYELTIINYNVLSVTNIKHNTIIKQP